MRKNSKQGFGKIKWLIAIGAFVLVVAIAIPVGFGFNKEDHPEVNTNVDEQIESTIPSDLKEVELGIIGGVRPGDVNFSEQTEQNTLTDKRDNETVVSQKPNAPEKITGSIDYLDKTTYVENKGQDNVREEKVYTDVYVDESIVVPFPPLNNTGNNTDDRKVIEVEAEKATITDKDSIERLNKDAETLFGDDNTIFEAEYADQNNNQ